MEATMAAEAHEDPAEDRGPWAAQIVVNLPKNERPHGRDVMAAAASGIARLLTDTRAAEGGPWHDTLQAWQGGRIRKLVRRARNNAWEQACTVEGVTVTVATATVHVCVPHRTGDLPPQLAKLQVSGLDLPFGEADKTAPTDGALVVTLNPNVSASTGKLAAQVGHAAHLSVLRMNHERLQAWAATGYQVQVETVDDPTWRQRLAVADVVVTDAGFTEVEPGTTTTVCIW